MRPSKGTFPKLLTVTVWALCAGFGGVAAAQQNNATEAQATAYPADVHPDSGFRLPLPKRDQLDALGKTLYDDMADPQSHAVVGLRGPLGIRLYDPKLGELASALSNYLRFESALTPPIRELIILTAARELDNQFEWTAHEPNALKAGLSQVAIDVVKYRHSTVGLPEKEAVVVLLGRQIFRRRQVDSETFARALKAMGERELLDATSLFGVYSATAILIQTFDMRLRQGQTPLLPLP